MVWFFEGVNIGFGNVGFVFMIYVLLVLLGMVGVLYWIGGGGMYVVFELLGILGILYVNKVLVLDLMFEFL